MKRVRNKPLAMLLAVLMVLLMVPAAFAEGGTEANRTDPLDFTSETASEDKLDAEGWKWDASKKTLTLNGLRLETEAGIAINLPADATINVTGDNYVKANGVATTSSDKSAGIEFAGAATITSDSKGTLKAYGCSDASCTNSYGIYYTAGELKINGDVILEAYGGAAKEYSFGIRSNHDHGALTISGNAQVNAYGGAAGSQSSYGILSGALTITGDAQVVAEGGEADFISAGIGTYQSLTLEGSAIIEAQGGKAIPANTSYDGYSYGIYNYGGSAYTSTIGGSAEVKASAG
ncbi:MAG: hypothetical protein Q4B48_02885, partial [Syntrophomonadaceae bacterium]|nr:hypothetical protein [Syntrophomonadaceae bacterium]